MQGDHAALGVEVFFDDMPEIVNRLGSDVLGLLVRDPDLGELGLLEE